MDSCFNCKIESGQFRKVINFALFRLIGRQSTRGHATDHYLTMSNSVLWGVPNDCIEQLVFQLVMYNRDQVLRLAYKSIYVVGIMHEPFARCLIAVSAAQWAH